MLHRTGSRKLHTAKKLTPHTNGKQAAALEDTLDRVGNNDQKDDASMKQALLEMDGTIINSSGPTFGDYMTKR
jgi:hypothetical protein